MPHYHVICSRPEAPDFALDLDAPDVAGVITQVAKLRPGATVVSATDPDAHKVIGPAEEAEGRRVIAEAAAAKAREEALAKAAAAAKPSTTGVKVVTTSPAPPVASIHPLPPDPVPPVP